MNLLIISIKNGFYETEDENSKDKISKVIVMKYTV
ncbi:hypothetical protein J2787_001067 [Chryseobacterium rhizosphaerae]|uniref:Uncharacterized protein n=1 Tax=Chryseobacterium rhizosphaerae TaxID=395937 RepID=A0AAE3Y877_9FLAO|nr:hypothetical protein [Chryseobacterium rhizosphaerae]